MSHVRWQRGGDCRRELENKGTSLRGDIATKASERKELKQEVKDYGEDHKIKRSPRFVVEADKNKALLALMVFTVVQLGANAVVFGQGSLYGLSFGLPIALGLAFFDIGWHFTFGRLAARAEAPDKWSKLVGSASSAVSVVSVTVFNLGMVHLRIVTRRSGAEGWEDWLPSLIDAPFGFNDFLSWALLAVGLFSSVLAFVAGWIWDEPIPLFRKLGRPIVRLDKDIRQLEEEERNLRASLLERFDIELDDIDENAKHHVSIISNSVDRIKQAEDSFGDYCDDADKMFVALVASYRDQNRKARTEPAPDFFDSPTSLAFDRHLPSCNEDFDAVERRAKQDREELMAKLPPSLPTYMRHGAPKELE